VADVRMTRGLAKPAQARALMIAVATLGLLLVTFLVLSHDQRARAAFPGENGRIAFDSNRDGDFEIPFLDCGGAPRR